MRRHLVWLGALFLLSVQGASAQPITAPKGPGASTTAGEPTLHLSATAIPTLAPDELVVDLNAVGTAPTAVMAQRRVNTLMAQSAKDAKGASGINATFRGYSVQFIDERGVSNGGPSHWVAQQTLELRGQDGEAVLDLVGRPQAKGLAIGSLGWEVSPDRAEKIRRQVTIDALKTLRAEADEDAGALGLEVDRVGTVDVGGGPRVFPMALRATAMAAAMPAPQATPEQQDISAAVTGEFVLRAPSGQGRASP